MKKLKRLIRRVIAIILIIVLCYVGYVFGTYHRIGDMDLEVSGTTEAGKALVSGEEYKIMTWNIGFGAYTSDYDFFMDGGHESWAKSPEILDDTMRHIAETLGQQNADLYIVQEVDFNGTRTYHVDERTYLEEVLTGDKFSEVSAHNYDSPFLMYPFYQPHGRNQSGIVTFSTVPITSAKRVGLPVESGFRKILDLDRCYSVSRIPVEDRELVLYNFHLSAYTKDGTISTEQLELILEDMQNEYENGNWVIAGGDFNKDLFGDSSKYFDIADTSLSWAKPFPFELLEGRNISLITPMENPVPTCRNCDTGYFDGIFVVEADGFMVTDNVEVVANEVLDEGFAYSDHNPVTMTFVLRP